MPSSYCGVSRICVDLHRMPSGRKGLACIGEFLGKWNDLMAESLTEMGQLAWRSLWKKCLVSRSWKLGIIYM